MKKLLLIVTLGLALSGCANLREAFREYNNPITKEMLYKAENTAIIAFAALKAYKASCQAKAIPQSCREVVAAIQVKTRQLPVYLKALRKFVKENDQISAKSVYISITDLLREVRAIADSNGIKVQ